MDENIIAWNVTNWVTVILMAAIGFFIIGLVLKWRQGNAGSGAGTKGGNVVSISA